MKPTISREAWSEYIQNEKAFFYNQLNLKAILLSEGAKEVSSMRKDIDRLIVKGEYVLLSKNKDGKVGIAIETGSAYSSRETERAEFFNHDINKFMTLLKSLNPDKNKEDNFREINLLRKYAQKQCPDKYKKFQSNYPEIASTIAYHLNSGGEEKSKDFTKSYDAFEKRFITKELSIYKLAVELGYKPKEYSAGGKFIPQHTIDEILKQTSLVDLIKDQTGQYLKYEEGKFNDERGKYVGPSPFSKDPEATIIVNVGKNYFYCDKSEEKGNAVNFIMAYRKLDFNTSMELLAEKIGRSITYQTQKEPKVYYQKGDSKLSLSKNEDSGLYKFYDHKQATGGTSYDLVSRDLKLSGEVLDKVMAEFAISMLSTEKLIEFRQQAEHKEGILDARKDPFSLLSKVEATIIGSTKKEQASKQSLADELNTIAKQHNLNINTEQGNDLTPLGSSKQVSRQL
jgi:hypothetical protein